MTGLYALPFGKDKAFFNNGRLMNYAVGGWTAGMITIYQSGAPVRMSGGLTSTVNPASDGGITFVGTTSRPPTSSIRSMSPSAPAHASYV